LITSRFELLYEVHFPPPSNKRYATVSRDDMTRELLVRVDEHADFVIAASGQSVACYPAPDCSPATLEQLVVDYIVPRAMHLRGSPCLHASAAAMGGRAVALVGDAGSGKSTLCAALCQRGLDLVCDDSLWVHVAADAMRVAAGYPSLRLWPDSAGMLSDEASDLPLASPRTSKRRLSRATSTEPLELAAVIVLAPVEGVTTPTLARLSGNEALAELARCVHRLDPENDAALRAEFDVLTELGARVPVGRLHFHHDYHALAAVTALVIRELDRRSS
jgi:hypothetical protein